MTLLLESVPLCCDIKKQIEPPQMVFRFCGFERQSLFFSRGNERIPHLSVSWAGPTKSMCVPARSPERKKPERLRISHGKGFQHRKPKRSGAERKLDLDSKPFRVEPAWYCPIGTGLVLSGSPFFPGILLFFSGSHQKPRVETAADF